jgi:hypothetical protein
MTRGLVDALALPPLSEFGVSESSIPEIVALARKASSMRFNPVALTDGAMVSILRSAILGYGSADG